MPICRGNIGLDVAPEKMAFVQKQLISDCNTMGKPVLMTRVVDSMVTNPRPTRAEATGMSHVHHMLGSDCKIVTADSLCPPSVSRTESKSDVGRGTDSRKALSMAVGSDCQTPYVQSLEPQTG